MSDSPKGMAGAQYLGYLVLCHMCQQRGGAEVEVLGLELVSKWDVAAA